MKTIDINSLISFNLSADHRDVIKMKLFRNSECCRDILDCYFDGNKININISGTGIIDGCYQGSVIEYSNTDKKNEIDNLNSALSEIEFSFLVSEKDIKDRSFFCPVLKHFLPDDIIGNVVIENGKLVAKLEGSIDINLLHGLGVTIGFNPRVQSDGHFSEMEIVCLSLGSNAGL